MPTGECPLLPVVAESIMKYCSWEKAWRAGCWAALGNATQAKYELQLTIQRDFEVRFMAIGTEQHQIVANYIIRVTSLTTTLRMSSKLMLILATLLLSWYGIDSLR